MVTENFGRGDVGSGIIWYRDVGRKVNGGLNAGSDVGNMDALSLS